MEINKNVAISDSGFVFNPGTGESFSVNPIGLEIILMIKKGVTFNDIYKTISVKYDVDETTFEKDYNDYVQLLTNYHLSNDANKTKA